MLLVVRGRPRGLGMSALAPGLWKATVRGVADTIVMVFDTSTFVTATTTGDHYYHKVGEHLTDARPLIVLDLEDHGRVNAANLAQVLREDGYPYLADQIEAQTKLARIEEPGLWGVVEAGGDALGGRCKWVHIEGRHDELNWTSTRGQFYDWDDLIDPVLVRSGVES